MKKTLYLECCSGISGDMVAAALLDLGADEAVLRRALASLPVSGFEVKISRVKKSGLDACDFDVVLDDAHENHDHDMAYLYGHTAAHCHEHEHEHCHAHEHDPVSYTHLTYSCWTSAISPRPAIWVSTLSKQSAASNWLSQESSSAPAMSLLAWSPATTISGRRTTLV